jgi:hypothetical protein
VFDGEIIDEDGALTAAYLLSRGYCCGNGCRNCPYDPRHGGPAAIPALRAVQGQTSEPVLGQEDTALTT